MLPTGVMVQSIRCENGWCVAKLTSRGCDLEVFYKLDRTGRLREIGRLPISITVEGWEVDKLVERVYSGETMEFPFEVQFDEEANPRRHFLTEPEWLDKILYWQEDVKQLYLKNKLDVGSHWV